MLHTLRLFLVLLLTATAFSQDGDCCWGRDLPQAQVTAKKEQRPILLLFGAIDCCPTSRCMETEVFHSEEFAKRCGRCIRVLIPLQSDREADLLALARARLQVLPTVYFLDPEGWPFAQIQGYRKGDGARTIARMDEILRNAEKLRKSPPDLRARHALYRKRGLHYGAALSAEKLLPRAPRALRRKLAPDLVAPLLVRGQKIDGLLEALGSQQATHECWLNALENAATWSIRLKRHAEAAAFLQRLLAEEKLKAERRLNATITLARLCVAVKAPCLARRHFEAARGICKDLAAREQAKRLEAWLARKVASITGCSGECSCRLPTPPAATSRKSPR